MGIYNLFLQGEVIMPRRGENIYKRKDNRWEGRYVRGYDSRGKAKFGYVYARTYKEVREKLQKARQSGGAETGQEKKNFSGYCDEWLVLSRNRVKESTYIKYYAIVHKHLKPVFGKKAPERITTVMIEHFSNRLLTEKKLSAKTVRDILAVLHSVLKYVGKQQGNPAQNAEIIYPKEYRKEMRVMTPREQTDFVQYLLTDMDSVKFGILLALLSGMRIGEICALKWRDICLEQKLIMISSTMQRLRDSSEDAVSKTKIIIGPVKSDCSLRVIPLTEGMETLCRHMLVSNPEAYVLTGTAEAYMEPRALQYRLKKYTAACNIEDVHFHTLRHTFATRCVEAGFEIKTLSTILGHSSVKITLDRYVHSSLELKRANMEKLSMLEPASSFTS